MSELTDEEIRQLEEKLLSLELALEEQLQIGGDAGGVVTLDQSKVGRVSRMDAMQQQQMALSTRSKSQQRLLKVKSALKAIESRDYGYCRRCDEDIGFPRLQAQPETPLCISCQNHSDNQQ